MCIVYVLAGRKLSLLFSAPLTHVLSHHGKIWEVTKGLVTVRVLANQYNKETSVYFFFSTSGSNPGDAATMDVNLGSGEWTQWLLFGLSDFFSIL